MTVVVMKGVLTSPFGENTTSLQSYLNLQSHGLLKGTTSSDTAMAGTASASDVADVTMCTSLAAPPPFLVKDGWITSCAEGSTVRRTPLTNIAALVRAGAVKANSSEAVALSKPNDDGDESWNVTFMASTVVLRFTISSAKLLPPWAHQL